MSTATTERQFTAANLDPALAEAVDAASPGDIIEGIVRLEDPRQVSLDFRVVSRFHRICTGRFAADRAWAIRRHPNVISLEATRSLGVQDDEVDTDASLAVRSNSWTEAEPPLFTGRGCIVAALDFGLDFAHPNFLRPDGTTRLMTLWHQGAMPDAPRIPTASAMAANIPARRSTRRCGPPIPTRRWATIPPSATPATAATAPTPWTSRPATAVLPAPGRARRVTPISCSSTCRRRASTLSATSAIRCASWRGSTTSTRSRAAVPGR